ALGTTPRSGCCVRWTAGSTTRCRPTGSPPPSSSTARATSPPSSRAVTPGPSSADGGPSRRTHRGPDTERVRAPRRAPGGRPGGSGGAAAGVGAPGGQHVGGAPLGPPRQVADLFGGLAAQTAEG